MPASLGTEEALLKLLVAKGAWTEKKAWLGLLTSGGTKKTTAKEFGEKELKESEGWTRVEVDAIEWEVSTKAEGATGFTIIQNKNAITGFGKITGAEEKTLEEFVIQGKAKQSEDEANTTSWFAWGKITTKITVNKTGTVEVAAKEIKIECE